jgi:hypothetical protein
MLFLYLLPPVYSRCLNGKLKITNAMLSLFRLGFFFDVGSSELCQTQCFLCLLEISALLKFVHSSRDIATLLYSLDGNIYFAGCS